MAAAIIPMVAAFLGGSITNAINSYQQTKSLCSQYTTIDTNTRTMNALMEQALQSYEAIDAELNQQIIQIQMQIADDAQKLQQLQFQYAYSHKIMQIFLGITLLTAALLLVFKHFNLLDWKQYLYLIFAMFTIGILSTLIYSYGFAPTCQSSLVPTNPTFELSQDPGCQCVTSSSCPFGCQSGCWTGVLNFNTSGAAAVQLQIFDASGNIVRDVVLPSFATSYTVSDIEGYSFAPLQVNIRVIDSQGCLGTYVSSWWINVDDFKSQNDTLLRSSDMSSALTATVDSNGNGTIAMAPYDPNSAAQKWVLWIDQSVSTSLFVLENQESKLLGGLTVPYSAQMVSLSYEAANLCYPQNCGVCPGGLSNAEFTQAFGLYTITDIVGGVALYYLRNDGNYGIFNTLTSVFDNSSVPTSRPLGDADIQPQWRMTYSLST